MDKVIEAFIGAVCIISGIILYGFVHLIAGSYFSNTRGWSSPPSGGYLTALNHTAGTIPAIIAIALFVIGLALLNKTYKNLK